MESITLDGLHFTLFLSESVILKRIEEMAKAIANTYASKNPIFLCVLNGSFYFTAELLKHMHYDYEISFVRVKSYDGLHSAQEIKEFIGLEHAIENRHIVIVEDIVESGLTTNYLITKLKEQNPASISIATLLFKPNKLVHPELPVDFVGFSISDEFVIGFGLDLNNKARNLRAIYQLSEA